MEAAVSSGMHSSGVLNKSSTNLQDVPSSQSASVLSIDPCPLAHSSERRLIKRRRCLYSRAGRTAGVSALITISMQAGGVVTPVRSDTTIFS